jgi:hypothetical protein
MPKPKNARHLSAVAPLPQEKPVDEVSADDDCIYLTPAAGFRLDIAGLSGIFSDIMKKEKKPLELSLPHNIGLEFEVGDSADDIEEQFEVFKQWVTVAGPDRLLSGRTYKVSADGIVPVLHE